MITQSVHIKDDVHNLDRMEALMSCIRATILLFTLHLQVSGGSLSREHHSCRPGQGYVMF